MADKITIFKEVFDYYYYGEITKEQLADLLLMHYETRWGNGVDVKEIEDKDLRMIWRTLQHSVIKSTKNAKQYEKQQNKKSALQDTVGTEFNITPVTNNIPSNEEIENKPILDTQITQDDNQYQEEVESGLNSLKMGNNGVIEDNTYMEQNIEDNNEEKDIEDMGNLLVFDETTGQYKYPSKTKEQIKEKVLENNLSTVKVAANKHNSDVERVQELINTDDDFYTAYSRYIKASIEYINDPMGRCTANSKDMAKVRLQTELDKHHITFNKDIMEMINRDINEIMKIRDIDVA